MVPAATQLTDLAPGGGADLVARHIAPLIIPCHDHDVIIEVVELRLDGIEELRERRGELLLAILHVRLARDDKEKVDLPLTPDRRAVAEVRDTSEVANRLGRT